MMLASFWDVFSNPAALAVTLAMLVPIVAVIASFWHSTEVAKSRDALKRSMVERGYSASEILQVLAAGDKKEKK